MNALNLRLLARRQFPGSWHVLFAVVICFSGLIMGGFVGTQLSRRSGASDIWALTNSVGACFWWLLVATRGCNLACHMAALRLPGTAALLFETLAVHLSLIVLLPLLVILALPYPADVLQLGGALALGSALGFLILCLPVLIWFPLMMGISPLSTWLGWSGESLQLWLTSAAILVLAIILWLWRLRSPPTNSWWLAPLAQTAATSTLSVLNSPKQERPLLQSCWDRLSTPRVRSSDPLAMVLGPRLSSIGQIYRWPGQCLTYLMFAAGTGLAMWLGPTTALTGAIVLGAPLLLALLAQEPSLLLTGKPGAHASRSLHAELLLLPGMPTGDALAPRLARQIVRSLTSKLVLFSLPVGLVAAAHGFPLAWVLWFALWALLMLPTSLLMTLLAWGEAPGGRDTMALLATAGPGILSSVLLYSCHTSQATAILIGWFVVGMGLVIATQKVYGARRRLGAPYFS